MRHISALAFLAIMISLSMVAVNCSKSDSGNKISYASSSTNTNTGTDTGTDTTTNTGTGTDTLPPGQGKIVLIEFFTKAGIGGIDLYITDLQPYDNQADDFIISYDADVSPNFSTRLNEIKDWGTNTATYPATAVDGAYHVQVGHDNYPSFLSSSKSDELAKLVRLEIRAERTGGGGGDTIISGKVKNICGVDLPNLRYYAVAVELGQVAHAINIVRTVSSIQNITSLVADAEQDISVSFITGDAYAIVLIFEDEWKNVLDIAKY
ncbi:MAG: hypothetical protein ACYS8W_03105 [Planctomycetota bacterium]|jgi:hypothetical protein